MTFSVIVPAHNAASTLERCLRSILALDPPPLDVIVADDGSTDETSQIARACGVTVVRLEERSGPSAARNAGAKLARGEYLAFTDSDCEVPKAWLANWKAVFAPERYSLVTGGYTGTSVDGVVPVLMDLCLRFRHRDIPECVQSALSANLCVRREDFWAVGGFSEHRPPWAKSACVTNNEDEVLSFLLWQKTGKPTHWCQSNGILHAYRPSLLGYLKQQSRYVDSVLLSFVWFPGMSETKKAYPVWGPAFQILVSWLALLGAIYPPLAVPFVALNARLFLYVARESRGSRYRLGAILGLLPFQWLTAMAWTYGGVTGVVRAAMARRALRRTQ